MNKKRQHYIGIIVLSGFLLFINTISVYSQKNDVYVDKNGVMRWGSNNTEIFGFGVNYTVPFAHAFRTAKKLQISLEKAIDDDVYHFARLGFDAYRVHVWDTEISDSIGNLLENEHLKLFDYALLKMKERGMKFIITPIAYWGNGWPEPDEKTPGFSAKYGNEACLTHPEAIKAQENYLRQFLNHVNSFTGVAYKDDPNIIAFEISNEPHHSGTPEDVTSFINRMVKSMRSTGTKKPIFYNVSHSIHLANAYFNADIQGGTFQWYPTGLGARHELRGNLLPNVEKYTIPFAQNNNFKNKARIVYEFDAADVGRSYIYPAMARSFREAGMQVATHFSYDPTYMAYANTEYGTHYMNLIYTPQKALSLKIASEVFHKVPMNKSFGTYPQNTSFDVFRISYENDLAEMVSDKKFIYTNHTATVPPAAAKLQQIAGFGNSPVVSYSGKGAYFLDKLENGIWRLEILPDAIWVEDPFKKTSLKKAVTVINWHEWPMTINLPNLGDDFSIVPVNEGNTFSAQVQKNSFTIFPGAYILTKKEVTNKLTGNEEWNNIRIKEFVAPLSTVKETYVLHKPVNEVTAGKPLKITATVVGVKVPESVELTVYGAGWRPVVLNMERVSGYDYSATVPENNVKEGFLRYYITIKDKDQSQTFPSGLEGKPADWDFYHESNYQIAVVPEGTPLYIFNSFMDAGELSRQWLPEAILKPGSMPQTALLPIFLNKEGQRDPENKDSEAILDYSARFHFGEKINGRKDDLSKKMQLVFRGHALKDGPVKLQLALVMKDGSAWGDVIEINKKTGDYKLPISALKKVRLVTLPRPYPSFLPYYFEHDSGSKFNLEEAETLQISIGPGVSPDELDLQYGVAVQSVRLE